VKALIVGGGTGGHIYPLIPVGLELKKRHIDVVFVGRKGSIEEKIYNFYGFRVRYVHASQFDKNVKSAIAFLGNTICGFFDALSILKEEKPAFVLGGGGYVSVPLLLSAILFRIPIFLYEQNIIPGRTNILFSRFSKEIFLGFPDEGNYFKGRGYFTGNPVRKEVLNVDRERALNFFNFEDKFTLLVFGGSGGAYKLNEIIFDILEPILNADIQVIFITGERFYSAFKDKVVHRNLRLFPYLNEMGYAYAVASLAITRGGAMTLSELVLNGVFSIVIPFPYAVSHHQFYNAKYFERYGVVKVIEECELSSEMLLKEVLVNRDKIRIMNSGKREVYPVDAEVRMVDRIMELMR